MKYSIIVPIYNVEKYLEECINSILNQSYTNYEIILVNDGSTDGSLDICNNYKKQIPHLINIINKKNEGAGSARRSGLKIANGDYIISIDGDDYIEKNLLSNIEKVLSKKEYDVVSFGYKKIKNGTVTDKKTDSIKKGCNNDIEEIKSCYLYDSDSGRLNSGNILYSMCCKAIKKTKYKEAIKKVPDTITNGEDTLFTAHLLNEIQSYYSLDYYGYYYRQNETSITRNRKKEDIINLTNVTKELKKIDYLETDRIMGYYCNCLWNILSGMANKATNYRYFKKEIDEIGINNKKKKVNLKIAKNNKKDMLKILILNYKAYKALYLIANFTTSKDANNVKQKNSH